MKLTKKTKRQNLLWRLSKVSTMSNASAFNFDPAWKKRWLLRGNRPRLATRRLDRVFRRIMALRKVFRDKLSPNFISIRRQGRRMTPLHQMVESNRLGSMMTSPKFSRRNVPRRNLRNFPVASTVWIFGFQFFHSFIHFVARTKQDHVTTASKRDTRNSSRLR